MMILLDGFGIDVTVILASAGVIGVAIAFRNAGVGQRLHLRHLQDLDGKDLLWSGNWSPSTASPAS
ncbi:MAG: mechanosensitive ion channel family protein [Anaerotruncus sp.]|nr:mechanosensitive ion channel family protein [Anaerotruncus sp.]